MKMIYPNLKKWWRDKVKKVKGLRKDDKDDIIKVKKNKEKIIDNKDIDKVKKINICYKDDESRINVGTEVRVYSKDIPRVKKGKEGMIGDEGIIKVNKVKEVNICYKDDESRFI